MARRETNFNIGCTELLITLDYLLTQTDEKHPARTVDICKYASEKYGLAYNAESNSMEGNEIDRRRIGKCLNFLKEFSDANGLPFKMVYVEGGKKYFVKERQNLKEKDLAKIIAAIQNDKYTKDSDVNYLVENILNACATTNYHKKKIKNECDHLLYKTKKLDPATLEKIRLIEKAYQEQKTILTLPRVFDEETNRSITYEVLNRVYLIKEFNHKLHALLIPVAYPNANDEIGKLKLKMDCQFQDIERIPIPSGNERDILFEDDERDFDELFKQQQPKLAAKYGTLDEMVGNVLLPKSGEARMVTFNFRLSLLSVLKNSFEQFFNEELRYQLIRTTPELDESIIRVANEIKNCIVVGEEPVNEPTHGLVNVLVDIKAFQTWLLSNPYGDGDRTVGDLITVIRPFSINRYLATYYCDKLINFCDYLNDEQRIVIKGYMEDYSEPFNTRYYVSKK